MLHSKDAEIIELYQSGKENEALKLLLSNYQKQLYWHIRRLVVNHENTNDVLQQTIIKVWKGLPNFKGDSKLYTWLFRIATNESLTFIEKNKISHLNVCIDDEVHLGQSTDQSDSIETEAIQLKLERAIATLPAKQKIVFHLKYYEDLKYEEIAEITQTSVGALKSSYHLAVKKIEDFLNTN
jgi:RNA polymerase sigma factor (sigma-70 family)